ncbi:hypothetical protein CALVIDRAFT_185671 [Calocera viscosa TUFC12733]|uniref:Uncharacterized protein n=1 Tax=Calocera viscosa (strain TUFC12733) TaxID=1330018 RepID=A0A167KT98_CALVF|nr:hypothetical protein CALVIDRAFT_185671 [Calocera viscosa TUFC12733]
MSISYSSVPNASPPSWHRAAASLSSLASSLPFQLQQTLGLSIWSTPGPREDIPDIVLIPPCDARAAGDKRIEGGEQTPHRAFLQRRPSPSRPELSTPTRPTQPPPASLRSTPATSRREQGERLFIACYPCSSAPRAAEEQPLRRAASHAPAERSEVRHPSPALEEPLPCWRPAWAEKAHEPAATHLTYPREEAAGVYRWVSEGVGGLQLPSQRRSSCPRTRAWLRSTAQRGRCGALGNAPRLLQRERAGWRSPARAPAHACTSAPGTRRPPACEPPCQLPRV